GTNSAITNSECEANAGLVKEDGSIAAARCKVKTWPMVGANPAYGKPTRAPLPTQTGGITTMRREELERFPVFQLYEQPALSLGARPVDNELRKNRTHVFDNDFVQQHYEDDEPESWGETQDRLYGVPIGCRE